MDASNIQIYTDILIITLIRSVVNTLVSINNVMTLNWQHTSCLAFVSSVLGNGDLLAMHSTLKCALNCHKDNSVLFTVDAHYQDGNETLKKKCKIANTR